jgi:hypothetical protein
VRRCVRVSLIVVTAASCGGNGDVAGPPPDNRAQLRGVVHEIPTGPRIPGATVTVQGQQALSDSDGNFTFPDLVAGETTVALSKTGYTAQTLRLTLLRGDNFFSLGMPRASAHVPERPLRPAAGP